MRVPGRPYGSRRLGRHFRKSFRTSGTGQDGRSSVLYERGSFDRAVTIALCARVAHQRTVALVRAAYVDVPVVGGPILATASPRKRLNTTGDAMAFKNLEETIVEAAYTPADVARSVSSVAEANLRR
jgi:hypothetical protein